ncbi:hypothetical protein FNV43_RR11571 [Rhamnella rubrinervis]|uniref:Lachrymatory factor synthase n=1 Tax=Rhamnella rubrinervis TaxID=2594499 RepID=A0A8K0MHV0_9ROSA|nr:hypothetical protein FNV43_RR11571 [Rhamnella rubrinervis]
MEEETQLKWEGEASVGLEGSAPQQVWGLLEDFCSIHKWHPNLDTSYQVDGVPGQPGLVRYCGITSKSSTMWVKEKLTVIDPIKRCLSYEIVDNNMGFKSYVGTMEVLPMINDADDEEIGCRIKWSFVCDPMVGWKYEDLLSNIESSLQFMAKKMEEHVSSLVDLNT